MNELQLKCRMVYLLRDFYTFFRAIESARGRGPTRDAQSIRRVLVAANFPGARNLKPAQRKRAVV